MTADRTSNTNAHAVDAAIALFSRQGYEQTTVEEIADAARVSRATFFRRYRSKEDVVFADHELLLEQVTVMLAATRPEALDDDDRSWDPATAPYLEVCRAARLVFDHHLGQRETSLARYRLLQQVPTLRDRELVTTHRYERLFTRYLRDTLPTDRSSTVQSLAFSAGVVAVHNAILRRWLRHPDEDLRPELEEALAELRRGATADLRHGAMADPRPDGPADPRGHHEPSADVAPTPNAPRTTTSTPGGARVVVVQVEPGTTADAVADAVRAALA